MNLKATRIYSLFIILLTAPTILSAQGIRFSELTIEEALSVAQRDGKILFVDTYMDWCAPCKYMDKSIFSLESFGTVYNDKFISIKVNGEKGDGIAFVKKYSIHTYPTYMYFSPSGILLKRFQGVQDKDTMLFKTNEAIAALNDTGSVRLMKRAYEEGQRDTLFMQEYLQKQFEMEGLCDTALLSNYLRSVSAHTSTARQALLFIAATIHNYVYGSVECIPSANPMLPRSIRVSIFET